MSPVVHTADSWHSRRHAQSAPMAPPSTAPVGGENSLPIESDEDPCEFYFRHGLTDGLPVVPCTRAKLDWMLSGTRLPASTVLGMMPPLMAECTIGNVAINAVMAGCEPRHLTVIISAVQGMLEVCIPV